MLRRLFFGMLSSIQDLLYLHEQKPALRPLVLHELALLLLRQLPMGFGAATLTVALGVLVVSPVSSRYELVLAVLYVCVLGAAFFVFVWLWQRRFADGVDQVGLKFSDAVMLFVTGVAVYWAAGFGYFLVSQQDNWLVLSILTGFHFGVLGGAISALAFFWRVYVIFAVVSTLPWLLLTMLSGNWQLQIFGLAVLLLLVSNALFAANVCRNSIRSIVLRFENNELIEQLKVKTQQAEQASIAKMRFLAAASHDLRQPIHALQLFLSALGNTKLDDNQQSIMAHATAAGSSGAQLLDTILDYSHMESGTITPKFATVPLGPMLFRLDEELGMQANLKDLVYRTRDTQLLVHCDASLLELVLRNFVSNAIRYTDSGGILVAARKRGAMCLIEVWDTGIGIAGNAQADIFKEFHQLNARQDKRQGLGLGLAIAKGLADKLGAKLVVQSELGHGSKFAIEVPLAHDDAMAMQALTSQALPARLNGLQVLVVDDDVQVLQAMAALLQQWGCVVQLAESVDEGIAKAEGVRPEVLITDYRLQNGDTGERMIAWVHEHVAENLPTIIITGDTAPELIRKTKPLAQVLLHKPVSGYSLQQALLTVLGS